jgi:hypothetical protein
MAAIVGSNEIARRPEHAFAYATDSSRFPEWQASAVSVRQEGTGSASDRSDVATLDSPLSLPGVRRKDQTVAREQSAELTLENRDEQRHSQSGPSTWIIVCEDFHERDPRRVDSLILSGVCGPTRRQGR